MNNLVVFYHKGTVDGKVSACIMKTLQPYAEYIPVDFTTSCRFSDVDVLHKDIYILGFPLQEKMWEPLTGYRSLTYISRQTDYVPPHIDALGDSESSTFITLWHHLFPSTELPLIYQHLHSYLNKCKFDSSENQLGYYICTILSFNSDLVKFSEKLAQLTANVNSFHVSSIYSEGYSYAKTIESLAKHLLDSASECQSVHTVFGVKCLIVNIPKIFNVFIKDYLFEKYSSVLTYSDAGDSRYWSFHSTQINARDLAKVFNGFGDKRSSGFSTTQSIMIADLNSIWENK